MASKNLSNEVYMLAGSGIKADFMYVATQLQKVDPREYTHTRLSLYDSSASIGWSYHDVDANVVSVCYRREFDSRFYLPRHFVCALSKEGEINFFSNFEEYPDVNEKIPDAGLLLCQIDFKHPKTGKTVPAVSGYVTHIREIGGVLYVCGHNGQVYRRAPNSAWQHLDADLFRPLYEDNLDAHHTFSCIDGSAENDIYVVGDDACLCHYDGKAWTELKLPIDEHLLWVRCYGVDEVWICGKNGTLLVGNAKSGFKDVSGVDDNYSIECVCKFQGKVYAASYDGLFVYDPAQPKLGLKPVKSGLVPEVQTMQLDASTSNDGATQVLWSFGVKDITWFDGTKWTRVKHPDNPPIE